MDRSLEKMVRRYCSDSFVITRNEESQQILGHLGVPTELGTDTAWTFEPLPREYGDKKLREAGWDGETPVLGLSPINPFWWPVRPSLGKLLLRSTTGLFRDTHYRSIYFHKDGARLRAAFHRYLKAFADGVNQFRRNHQVFPVLIGMEALDRRACEIMGAQLGNVPLFISDEYDMFHLVSILRCCQLLVSSRYHGIVTCMPAMVPSAGITMDERIRNLMRERGQQDLLLEVTDPNLSQKLVPILEKLLQEREAIRSGIGRTVARNLKLMARMGVYFQEQVSQCYPEFPLRTERLSWEDFLPPLSPALQSLVETYEENEA
jgi:polysaccharide pyruvyl transferase WcaK-like protein